MCDREGCCAVTCLVLWRTQYINCLCCYILLCCDGSKLLSCEVVVFTADVFLKFSFAIPGLCVGVVMGVWVRMHA